MSRSRWFRVYSFELAVGKTLGNQASKQQPRAEIIAFELEHAKRAGFYLVLDRIAAAVRRNQ